VSGTGTTFGLAAASTASTRLLFSQVRT